MNLRRVTNNGYEPENTDGRSVIPRRLPPVPNLSPLRSPSSPISSASPSPPSSVSSLSPSSFGSPSPASSPGSASSNYSPTKALNVLKRTPPRPLPQIPSSRHVSSPTQKQPMTNQNAQLIVCRSCMNCVTTSESLLPSSAVSASFATPAPLSTLISIAHPSSIHLASDILLHPPPLISVSRMTFALSHLYNNESNIDHSSDTGSSWISCIPRFFRKGIFVHRSVRLRSIQRHVL